MLNDPTKDQILPNELVEKGEVAKVAESAGNFSNLVQNQQGLILAAVTSKGKWHKFFCNKKAKVVSIEETKAKIEAGIKMRQKNRRKLPEQLKTNGIEIAQAQKMDKPLVLGSAEKAIGNVLFAPIDLVNYVFDRIYNRSSFLQELSKNLDGKIDTLMYRGMANRTARNWAKDTGASAVDEKWQASKLFNYLVNGHNMIDKDFAKRNAEEWAKKVGASVEAKKKYASSLLYRETVANDYEKLTRNEFKKKYPHIKTPEHIDLTHKRPSIARIIKSIRGYRVPDVQVENYVFNRQLNIQLGIDKSIYF